MNHNSASYIFTSFYIALLAKLNGFDEPCLAHYRDNNPKSLVMVSNGLAGCAYSWVEDDIILAPTYDQVFTWFKEQHRIKIREISYTSGKDKWYIHKWDSKKCLWDEITPYQIKDKETAILTGFNLLFGTKIIPINDLNYDR